MKFRNLNSNNKIVIKNIIAAFIIKGGGMVISLLTMPAYIKYFGDQTALGVWFTLLSLLTWILSFDLGIGNGLRNKLVGSIAKNDRKEMKQYISSATFSMFGIILLAMIVVGIIIPTVNWNSVFNVETAIYSKNVLMTTMFITFIGVLMQFFFKIITSVIYALQKSSINNFIFLITSVLQLLYISFAPSMDVSKAIISLSIVNVLCVCVPMIVAALILFFTILKDCKPNIKFCTKLHSKAVLGMGGLFFACQVFALLIFATNELLISNLFSPENVVVYQAYYKIFLLVSTVFSLALTPIWSIITKAQEEKNYMWLKKTFKIMELSLILVMLFEFLLIFMFDFIAKIWLGSGTINSSMLYSISFAIFGFLFVYVSTLNTVLNGLGAMKVQTIVYIISIIIKFSLLFIIRLVFNDWIIVVLCTSISLVPYCIVEHIYIRRWLDKHIKMIMPVEIAKEE